MWMGDDPQRKRSVKRLSPAFTNVDGSATTLSMSPTRFLSTAWKRLFLVSLFAGILTGLQAASGLHVGTGEVDITPKEWPLPLVGGWSPKPTDEIHDPLHARALAFKNGDGQAVIVIVDNLMIGRETHDEIRAIAAKRTGWKPKEMLIGCTHAHSAPPSGPADDGPRAAYHEQLKQGIAEAIAEAVKGLKPAKVGFGSADLPEEVFNRRWYLKQGTMPPNPFGGMDTVKMNPSRSTIVRPAGPTDPEICIVSVQSLRNRHMGLLANYSLHYVGNTQNKVSADYFGVFADLMPTRVGSKREPEFVAMMSNGTSGDINNIDFTGTRAPRAPFEQIDVVATKAADTAWQALKGIETYSSDVPVKIVQREVPLKWRRPTPDQLEEARRILKMSDEEKKELPRHADTYAQRTIRQHEYEGQAGVILQAVRIGDQAIVSLPFEVLVEIGLEIKEKSPFKHTFVIELANGAFGYLPTPRQHELGGYETWLGTNRVQMNASDILTKHLLEMLNELK